MKETVSISVRKRGFFGYIFKILFFIFNALMAIWLISAFITLGDMPAGQTSAEQAGAAVGSALGIGLLLFIWVLGGLILGGLTLATRGKLVTTTIERDKQ